MTGTVDDRELYRLPRSLPDNAIAWLEEPERFGDFVQMIPAQREG